MIMLKKSRMLICDQIINNIHAKHHRTFRPDR